VLRAVFQTLGRTLEMAGHVSRRPLRRYSHFRLEATGNAMEARPHVTKEAG